MYACRFVPEQPLSFRDTAVQDAPEFFNLRKLNQLPFHLAHAQLSAVLINECIFNFEWLKTKLRALSVQHLIRDCRFCTEEEVPLCSVSAISTVLTCTCTYYVFEFGCSLRL